MEGKKASIEINHLATELDLSGLKLGRFPKELLQCNRLRVLNLSNNRLKNIPPALFELPNLRTLDLSRNKIEGLDISENSGSLLRDLNLSSNKLIQLPNAIAYLQELSILKLSSNKISKVALDWKALYMLRELDLSSNAIEKIDSAMGKCRLLRRLDLSNNKIVNLPLEFRQLSQLESIDLSKNPLGEFYPNKADWPYLKSLNLAKTSLARLERSYLDFPMLRMLNTGDIPLDRALVLEFGWKIDSFRSKTALRTLRDFSKKCAEKQIPPAYRERLYLVYSGEMEASELDEDLISAGLSLSLPRLNKKLRPHIQGRQVFDTIQDLSGLRIYFDKSCAVDQLIREEWVGSVNGVLGKRQDAQLFVYGSTYNRVAPQNAIALATFLALLATENKSPSRNQRDRLAFMLSASSVSIRALAFSIILKRYWTKEFRVEMKNMTEQYSDPLAQRVQRFLKAERTSAA